MVPSPATLTTDLFAPCVSGGYQPPVFKIIANEGASGLGQLTKEDLNLIEPATDEWVGGGERLSRAMAENADFTAVGVLGAPSVGKSELLSQLCGAQSACDSLRQPH